jgi:hypothetical protein
MNAHEEQVFAGQIYNVMAALYKTGLMEKLTKIQGEAIDIAVREIGLSMGDLVNMIDAIGEESVLNADKSLLKARKFLPLLSNGRLFAVISRILDNPLAVNFVRKTMVRKMTGGGSSLDDNKFRVKGFIENNISMLKNLLSKYI